MGNVGARDVDQQNLRRVFFFLFSFFVHTDAAPRVTQISPENETRWEIMSAEYSFQRASTHTSIHPSSAAGPAAPLPWRGATISLQDLLSKKDRGLNLLRFTLEAPLRRAGIRARPQAGRETYQASHGGRCRRHRLSAQGRHAGWPLTDKLLLRLSGEAGPRGHQLGLEPI